MTINIDNIDKRVRERYVTNGTVKPSDLEAFLGKLPDLENNCDNIYDDIFGKLEARAREQ